MSGKAVAMLYLRGDALAPIGRPIFSFKPLNVYTETGPAKATGFLVELAWSCWLEDHHHPNGYSPNYPPELVAQWPHFMAEWTLGWVDPMEVER